MSQLHEKTFYRYMSEAELEAVEETGQLRGGRPGKTFWTSDVYDRAEEARSRLSLDYLPEVRLEFRITGELALELDGTEVEPAAGEPGGGTEYMSRRRVEVEVIRIDRIV